MLGHIAIAAMGGCFSQNPDTGAAEATYFPAESVTLKAALAKSVTRVAGTTDFQLGVTDTRFFTKGQAISWEASAYPPFAALGALQGGYPRTMMLLGVQPRSIVHQINETPTVLTAKINPSDTWICRKANGENYSEMANGGIFSRLSISKTRTFDSSNISFRTFSTGSSYITVFCGDLMSNEHYAIHWRRLPMKGAETQGIGIFEVHEKQFIEYAPL